MSSIEDWRSAYARQAAADFDTWHRLQPDPDVPDCHKLLFLQMACEKLTKAHLCGAGSQPQDLQSSHAYTAKTLPLVIRTQTLRLRVRPATARSILKYAKLLAREIELLAPAVNDGGKRPDNCEYPWEDASDRLHVPLDWTFAPSGLLTAPAGRTFLKLIRGAIDALL